MLILSLLGQFYLFSYCIKVIICSFDCVSRLWFVHWIVCQDCYLIIRLCQKCCEPIICNARSSPFPAEKLLSSSTSTALLQFVIIIVITNYLILRLCHGCHKVIPLSHRHRNSCLRILQTYWGEKFASKFFSPIP